MINDIGIIERYLIYKEQLNGFVSKFFYLSIFYYQLVYSGINNGRVVQRFIDSYIVVIGYYNEKDDFYFIKKVFSKELGYVVFQGDGSVFRKRVYN